MAWSRRRAKCLRIHAELMAERPAKVVEHDQATGAHLGQPRPDVGEDTGQGVVSVDEEDRDSTVGYKRRHLS